MANDHTENLSEPASASAPGGHTGEAAADLQEAIRAKPNDPEAYHNLARSLAKQSRWEAAILCFRQALRLKPDYADAHRRLGDALYRHPRTMLDEAISCYREAIRHNPNDAKAFNRLGGTLNDVGLLDEAVAALQRACQLRPDSSNFHSVLLFCLHYQADSAPALLAREHGRWNEQYAEPLAPLIQPHVNDREPNRRLRIGYVSPNFNKHPVGRFLVPLFDAHDHDNFEIYCYSSGGNPDKLTDRLRSRSDRWHCAEGLTDEGLADLIRRDRIDVLVELDLHSGDNRLLTLARKPAPVQVSYLGYCSTTGLRAIDYRLTDPFLDPVGQPRQYAEESVWLPETYWCYEPLPESPPVGPLPALTNDYVTFGSLNKFCKATLPTWAMWRELVQKVPGSRLLLYAKNGSHRDRVLTFFSEAGIDPGRIEFTARTRLPQYFARYNQIDISLDPFPFAGGTTTCDSLWMGVPVISLAGKSAVARAGLSILSNVGLPELVAQTPAEYVRIGAELAADLPRLAALRAGMRDRMQRSALMDGPRFARGVEAAYRAMWRRWCAKAAAADGGAPAGASGAFQGAQEAKEPGNNYPNRWHSNCSW